MDNGFKGRGKNVTGSTSGIHKRGEGVSSGKLDQSCEVYCRRDHLLYRRQRDGRQRERRMRVVRTNRRILPG